MVALTAAEKFSSTALAYLESEILVHRESTEDLYIQALWKFTPLLAHFYDQGMAYDTICI